MAKTTKLAILRQLPAARDREAHERETGRRTVSVHYDVETDRVMMELTSGFVFGFPPQAIPALAHASPAQLAAGRFSSGGGGQHWEELDADLSVRPGLLLESLDRPARLRELARLAGRTRSAAKATAARANGAEGGRPRKASRS